MAMMRSVAISTVRITVFFGLFFLFSIGFVALIAPMLGVSFDDPDDNSVYRGVTGVVIGGGLLASAILAAALTLVRGDIKSPIWTRRTPGLMLIDLSLGSFVGAFVILAGVGVAVLFGWARIAPQFDSFSIGTLGMSALGLTLYAASEEVMMRGCILPVLLARFSTTAAVVVSSLIFVALHVPDLVEDPVGVIGVVGGVSIFLASILMSFAYLRSGAIWLPIGIHAGHNIALGPVLGINFSGADLSLGWHAIALQGPNALTDGRLGFEIATLSGLVIGIAMMLFFVRRAA